MCMYCNVRYTGQFITLLNYSSIRRFIPYSNIEYFLLKSTTSFVITTRKVCTNEAVSSTIHLQVLYDVRSCCRRSRLPFPVSEFGC